MLLVEEESAAAAEERVVVPCLVVEDRDCWGLVSLSSPSSSSSFCFEQIDEDSSEEDSRPKHLRTALIASLRQWHGL